MNLMHLGSELRRFGHGKLPPIALVTIMMLPLLFGGLFVWSYWDPVGRINRLPVAYVNSDQGTEATGTYLNAGDQITERLLSNDKLNLTEVSAEEARRGVADGTYYFALEIPTDFSEAVVSVKGDHPHQATLNTLFNNDNGLIATTLGNQVVTNVLATMNSRLGEKVVDNLLVGFNTVGEGMKTAAEGAAKLHDGASTASTGGTQLDDGARRLADGIAQADSGARELAEGASTLDAGIGSATAAADQLSAGLAQLDAATDTLGAGAAQVSGGVGQIEALAQQGTAAQEQLIVPLVNISAQLRGLNLPQAVGLANQVDAAINSLRTQGLGPESELVANLRKLSGGAAEIARQLTDPTADYRAGMDKASSGSAQLAAGMHRLQDGSSRLVVGAQTLSQGTSKLVDGSQQLTVGASQLSSGLVRLDEGAGELALKLSEGADKVPAYGDDVRASYSTVIATPVVRNQIGDTLSLFGMGLAPIFISLGLFMGATVTWMLVHPTQRRAVDSGTAPLRVVLASYLPAALVGIAQASFMFAVQKWALHLDAAHEAGMWLSMCFAALMFQIVTLGINSFLGATAGRVVCLVLMSLQIVSSGGLYPPETQPAFLKWFHTYDPMTYTVQLLRQMIFHLDTSMDTRLFQSLGAMATIMALFAVLAVLGARRARTLAMKDLHPEITI